TKSSVARAGLRGGGNRHSSGARNLRGIVPRNTRKRPFCFGRKAAQECVGTFPQTGLHYFSSRTGNRLRSSPIALCGPLFPRNRMQNGGTLLQEMPHRLTPTLRSN